MLKVWSSVLSCAGIILNELEVIYMMSINLQCRSVGQVIKNQAETPSWTQLVYHE